MAEINHNFVLGHWQKQTIINFILQGCENVSTTKHENIVPTRKQCCHMKKMSNGVPMFVRMLWREFKVPEMYFFVLFDCGMDILWNLPGLAMTQWNGLNPWSQDWIQKRHWKVFQTGRADAPSRQTLDTPVVVSKLSKFRIFFPPVSYTSFFEKSGSVTHVSYVSYVLQTRYMRHTSPSIWFFLFGSVLIFAFFSF